MVKYLIKIKGKNINKLLPEVKINLAMAKNDAKNSDDIAAFINGIIVVDNKFSNNFFQMK